MLLQDRNDSESARASERVSCGIDNRSFFSCLFSFGFSDFGFASDTSLPRNEYFSSISEPRCYYLHREAYADVVALP